MIRRVTRESTVNDNSSSVNTTSILNDLDTLDYYIDRLQKFSKKMKDCVSDYNRGSMTEKFSDQMDYFTYKVTEMFPRIKSLIEDITVQSK